MGGVGWHIVLLHVIIYIEHSDIINYYNLNVWMFFLGNNNNNNNLFLLSKELVLVSLKLQTLNLRLTPNYLNINKILSQRMDVPTLSTFLLTVTSL